MAAISGNIMSQADNTPLYIHYAGPALVETPLLNKGSAFSREERAAFNLTGLLPPRYETIEEQAARAYMQYSSFEEPINKHIYLRVVQDNNETLFHRLLQNHLEEMLPIIYTPTVGDACERFSDIYRSARGLFISYSDRDQLDDVLDHGLARSEIAPVMQPTRPADTAATGKITAACWMPRCGSSPAA